jgi:hypothetical protein
VMGKSEKEPYLQEIRRTRPPSSSRVRRAALARLLRLSSLIAERGFCLEHVRPSAATPQRIESEVRCPMPI